jgi:predicted RNA methylase
MHALVEDADLIFRRGLVEAFCRLDRRFRSHDGFKLGARIILPYMFCEYTGTLNSDRAATLRDVERVFYVLDSKAPPTDWNGGICGAIRTAKPQYCGPAAYEAECPYFKVRAYQNRNAHVWFRREDLVRKVNRLLAEYYGFAIGASPDAPHERRHEPNRTPARRMGDFATPHKLAAAVVRAAQIKPGHRVLEPSAGAGNLAVLAHKAGGVVTAVEAQGQYIGALRSQGLRTVVHGDFFDQTPDVLGKFERIVMNPPFDGARDVDHVSRALDYLEPGGVLVAIMSAGVEFREDKKTTDFRARVERLGGSFVDLPDGSFRESGTMVNTCACIIGRSSYFICWSDM